MPNLSRCSTTGDRLRMLSLWRLRTSFMYFQGKLLLTTLEWHPWDSEPKSKAWKFELNISENLKNIFFASFKHFRHSSRKCVLCGSQSFAVPLAEPKNFSQKFWHRSKNSSDFFAGGVPNFWTAWARAMKFSGNVGPVQILGQPKIHWIRLSGSLVRANQTFGVEYTPCCMMRVNDFVRIYS